MVHASTPPLSAFALVKPWARSCSACLAEVASLGQAQ
jgi:hypothetical protein